MGTDTGGGARLVLAGLAGDTGKSLVTLGLIGALRRRGLAVAPFKKGPDFIDAAWLGAAAGTPGRNLDTFMMPAAAIRAAADRASRRADIVVVEGNRGLHDGLDARGTHSTAGLARLIDAPVVLVVDVTKATRTVAASVLGCQLLDRDLRLAGVILNRVGTSRQEALVREAVTEVTGLPVVGAIRRLTDADLPSRHLGLVTSVEHPRAREMLERVASLVEAHVDLDQVLDIAATAAPAARAPGEAPSPRTAAAASAAPDAAAGSCVTDASRAARAPRAATGREARVRIGVLRDRAFSFYYPENLEALEAAGAEVVPISPLADPELPPIDALYAGGGFPEVHAAELAANRPLRKALRGAVDDGLPVWAECGGLMYLSRAVIWKQAAHDMVGVLPFRVEQLERPQGHGYVEAHVDRDNPFLAVGTELRGHEFHYSRVAADDLEGGGGRPETVLALRRGAGFAGGRDGVRRRNVVAAYTHVHAAGAPVWATGLVAAARGACAAGGELR